MNRPITRGECHCCGRENTLTVHIEGELKFIMDDNDPPSRKAIPYRVRGGHQTLHFVGIGRTGMLAMAALMHLLYDQPPQIPESYLEAGRNS